MRLHGTHFVAAVAAARNGWRHADGAPVIDHRSSGWSSRQPCIPDAPTLLF